MSVGAFVFSCDRKNSFCTVNSDQHQITFLHSINPTTEQYQSQKAENRENVLLS